MKLTRHLVSSCLIAAMAMTGAAHAQTRAEHSYCQALTALSADLNRLEKAPPQTTMKEHRDLIDKIKQDAMAIEKDAIKTRTEAGKQLVMSSRKLSQEAKAMPDDMTLKQARTKMGDELQNVRESARQLAAESGCPGAIPGEALHPKPPAAEGTHTY
jgi:hypothetical protein